MAQNYTINDLSSISCISTESIRPRDPITGILSRLAVKQSHWIGPEKLIFGLKKYLANPENVERSFNEGKFKFEK